MINTFSYHSKLGSVVDLNTFLSIPHSDGTRGKPEKAFDSSKKWLPDRLSRFKLHFLQKITIKHKQQKSLQRKKEKFGDEDLTPIVIMKKHAAGKLQE